MVCIAESGDADAGGACVFAAPLDGWVACCRSFPATLVATTDSKTANKPTTTPERCIKPTFFRSAGIPTQLPISGLHPKPYHRNR